MSNKNKKASGNSFTNLFKVLFGGQNKVTLSVLEEEQMQSPFRTIVKNFMGNKIAMAGVIVFITIFLICFIVPIFLPLDTTFQDPTQQNIRPGFQIMNLPKALANNAKQIEIGSTFGIGVDGRGVLYEWGNLSDKLKKVPAKMGKITQVSAGLDHVLALNEKGEVFTWGNDRFGLGRVPSDVKDAKDIKQVVAGFQISLVVTEDGHIYNWGNENLINISFKEVQGNVDKVVVNTSTVLVLTKDGQVEVLSSSDTPFSRIPEEIQGNVIDIATTDKSAAALTKDGNVVAWGSSDYEVLEVPVGISGRVTQIAGGRSHLSALTKEGKVVSWGNNNNGQSNAPASASDITSISSGYYQNYGISSDGKVTSWGLKGYLMGTDQMGRDIFTRLVSGGRMSMTIGAIAVVISTIIGVIIGGFSGYYGGKIDIILMRITEIIGSLPFLPLAMILSAIVGNNVSELGRISMIMVILGLLSWPGLARLVRAQILAEREKEFVTAAKAMGIRELNIIFKHIVPNVITVIIVNTTLNFASCLLTESSLSFLGFGVIEPNPTWGNMLTGSQSSTVIANFWWRWVFPSIALSLSTISINLIGDGLRDAIDPKSNER